MVRLCAAPRASARRANISGQHEPRKEQSLYITADPLGMDFFFFGTFHHFPLSLVYYPPTLRAAW